MHELIDVWNKWHILIIFVGSCLTVLIGSFVLYWFLQTVRKISRHKYTALLKKYWLKSLFIIFLLFFLYIAESFISVPKEYYHYYSQFLTLLVIMFLVWFVIQVLYSVRDYIIKSVEKASLDDINVRAIRTKLNIFLKIAIFVVIVIGTACALMIFPKIHKLGISVLASAGVAGVIVGFAAQKSLSSLLVGVQIALTQPIRIDDVVVVEGEWGSIEEITLTYVIVRTWDRRRLVLPITYFVEKIFQNWTRTSFDIIGTVFLQLDHATPIDEMRTELGRILEGCDLWDGRVNKLDVTDANAQAIEIRVLVSAAKPSILWDLRCYVREKLIGFLQKNYPNCLPKGRLEIKEKW